MALNRNIMACLALLPCLVACEREQMDDCFTSTGSMRLEVREIPAFRAVDIDDRMDLVLHHRPTATISVEAGSKLLDQITTSVENGVLMIRNKNRCNWVRSFKPKITVHVPLQDVQEITARGAGDITSADTIRQTEFRFEQWGAMGTADLIVDVHDLFIGLHTGAGDVVLHGRCSGQANLYSDMLGTIDASDMHANHVSVNNSGVGDFRCRANNGLDVQIRDAGDVYYSGDPVSINSEITGTGRLIRME